MMIMATSLFLSPVMINLLAVVTLIKSPKGQLHGQGMLVTLVLSHLLFVLLSMPSAVIILATGRLFLTEKQCDSRIYLLAVRLVCVQHHSH